MFLDILHKVFTEPQSNGAFACGIMMDFRLEYIFLYSIVSIGGFFDEDAMSSSSIWTLIIIIVGWISAGGFIGFMVTRRRGYPFVLGMAWGAGISFVVLVSLCLIISRVSWMNELFI